MELDLLTIESDSMIFDKVLWKLADFLKNIPDENTGEVDRLFPLFSKKSTDIRFLFCNIWEIDRKTILCYNSRRKNERKEGAINEKDPLSFTPFYNIYIACRL